MADQRSKKVLIGMSGGVDSTAAALLLLEQGFDVTALYFDVLGDGGQAEQAEAVARSLAMPFIYRNIAEEFETLIIDAFCTSYTQGQTPNPCVRCNPLVKFRIMLNEAEKCGAGNIATGHYARVGYVDELGRFAIFKGASNRKDQSYMLYALGQDVLSRVIFPLGDMRSKEDVRAIVRGRGLLNAEARDSQEICFIRNNDYAEYILAHGYASPEGDFIDEEGHRIGTHRGLVHYTIGQRKGLGKTFGKPQYVIALDPERNAVQIGDETSLFKREAFALCDLSTFAMKDLALLESGIQTEAKIRYAAKPAEALVTVEKHASPEYGSGLLKAAFKEPQRAITPGQSLVFYQGDMLVGGGILCGSR